MCGGVSNKHCLLPFFILAGIEDMHQSLDEFEFQQICNRVTYRPIKTKFCIHIIIDKIDVGFVNHCFSQILQQSYGP